MPAHDKDSDKAKAHDDEKPAAKADESLFRFKTPEPPHESMPKTPALHPDEPKAKAPAKAAAPKAPAQAEDVPPPPAETVESIRAKLADPTLVDPVERQRLADLDRELTRRAPEAAPVFDAAISRGAEPGVTK